MKVTASAHSVKEVCQTLHLCRSTYYQYQHQTKPEQFKRRQVLYQQIRRIYFDHRRVYGAPKVHEELLREGYHASLKLVQKLMRHLGLRSIVVKKWRYEHNNYIDQMTYPNLLKQDFKAVKPNQKWAADITYIPTKTDGWCYLATIMDLYSRKIIAHKLSRHMTTELVVNVLNQACETRTVKAGLILHTDLGSQYRSIALETALKQHAIRHSYSKRGYPYDNSVVESFHASFKKEEVYQRTYKDYHEANLAQFSYIEGFYNSRRIISADGYLTPDEKEQLVS
nr:IS3 family transposase [Liquorilactobacillus nagelii]